MRNIKLTLEYDGTNYCGWQIQSHRVTKPPRQKPSIQETVEKALRKIFREKIKITGAGRTDAGVHAFAQVANFKTKSGLPLSRVQQGLNAALPDDIVVTSAQQVGVDFHSRFRARSKLYRYAILNRQHPGAFLHKRAYFFRYPLDIGLMRRESKALLGRHDFSSFQSSGTRKRNAVKTIKKITFKRHGDLVYIDIEGDGFLYNMARNIVGTLIEIGRGHFKKGRLKKILSGRDRRLAGPTAAAKGLYLVKVGY